MFTLDQMIDAVKAEVEGNEDFVYPGSETGFCTYADDAAPSCLVGRALHRLGLPLEELQKFDNCQESSISYINNRFEILDPMATRFAVIVQGEQDAGFSWGAAFKDALQALDAD